MTSNVPRLRDPDLPAVEVLLSKDALAPLSAAFAMVGVDLENVQARQVVWWPGRSVTVRYEASIRGGGSAQVVACAGTIPDGAVVVEAAGTVVGLWTLPNDPALPGLASALAPATLAELLAGMDLDPTGLQLRLRAYRPTRRAVVEVRTATARLFLKLGRPSRIARLHETHRALREVLPVPNSLGYDPDLGILAMPAGRGQTLRQLLDGEGRLPEPGELAALLHRLPPPLADDRALSPIERLQSLTGLLARIVPDMTQRVAELVRQIGPESDEPLVPVHGDFHDGQLLVDAGVVSGLLDVDTHGLGHANDDPATLLMHLSGRRDHAPRPQRVDEMTSALLGHWRNLDPFDLRRRMAAVQLGLATGPFRVQQEDWPAATRARIARAESLMDESPLIAVSGRSHGRAGH